MSATLCLRLAAQGKSIWYAVVGIGYLLAFTLLSLTLEQGMSLGVAYGTWAAAGVALTAVASRQGGAFHRSIGGHSMHD